MKYSDEEIKAWNELYEYVKLDIMKYDLTMNLTKYMVLKLKELRHGTIMANKHQNMSFYYSYEDILLAFKLSKPIIENSFSNKTFKNENFKFGYAMGIVKNNINEIKLIKKRKEDLDQKIESIEVNKEMLGQSSYKKKEKKISDRLKKIW